VSACTIRLDSHAHLYEGYSVRRWCDAIAQNLQLQSGIVGAVIVVDRAGQDAFSRLRNEVPAFALWEEHTHSSGAANVGSIVINGRSFFVIRGVQYISVERIEVLGLGIARSGPDGVSASALVQRIADEGGVACLPWSPGKWLGKRGSVVRSLIAEVSQDGVVFGDISLRTSLGPPSLLLREARRAGFRVLPGTDPLPRLADETLAGSYGVAFSTPQTPTRDGAWEIIKAGILNKFNTLDTWGAPNKLSVALARFLSAV
jgi:hypothetical protein